MRLRISFFRLMISCICFGVIASAVETGAALEATPEPFEAPRFEIYPIGDFENSWFEVTLEPGASMNLKVGMRNSGNVPVILHTYASNAFNPPNGGFAASEEEETASGATLWVDYPSETFHLDPGEGREIDLELTVPLETLPGEYVVGLVIQTAESWEVPGSDMFRQIIRNVMSLEVLVPGEMSAGIELGEPEVSYAGFDWMLDIPITNTGTARLRPEGLLVVTSADGTPVSSTDLKLGSVYGNNTSSVRVILPEQLPVGTYVVDLSLTDPASGVAAELKDVPVTLEAPADPTGVSVVAASVEPNAAEIIFANVDIALSNGGAQIPASNVVLQVMRDGEQVDEFPLARNQVMLTGENEYIARYIPPADWEMGTYTFRVEVSSVDPDGGQTTVLLEEDLDAEIVVP